MSDILFGKVLPAFVVVAFIALMVAMGWALVSIITALPPEQRMMNAIDECLAREFSRDECIEIVTAAEIARSRGRTIVVPAGTQP